MTEGELSVMERMWSRNVPAKRIAEVLGYSTDTILRNAMNDRHRFPFRRHKINRRDRELWVSRITSGRYTKRQAMEALGVCDETVNRWLRARKGDDEVTISGRSENLYTSTLSRRNLCDMVATLEEDKKDMLLQVSELRQQHKSMARTMARLEEELADMRGDGNADQR